MAASWIVALVFIFQRFLVSTTITIQVTSSCSQQVEEFISFTDCRGPLPEFQPGTNLSTVQLRRCDFQTLSNETFGNIIELKVLTIMCDRKIQLAEGSLHPLSNAGLTELHLLNNSIATVPVDTFCPLGTLNKLRLDNNVIVDVETLGFGDSGHPCAVGQNLTELWLRNNKIRSIPEGAFGQLVKLDVLDVTNNEIEHIHPLAFRNLRSLRYLGLDNNKLSVIPNSAFHAIIQLQSLYMNLNLLDDRVFQAIDVLVNLQVLLLGHNRIENLNPNTLRKMNSMITLMLQNNFIKNIPPLCFANMTELVLLSLDSNHLSSIVLSDLSSQVNLVNLGVANNSLVFIAPDALSALKSLIVLSVDRNMLQTMPNITGLMKLSTINVSYNQINVLPDKYLVDREAIFQVDMSNNQLRYVSSASIRNLTILMTLDLSRNQIETIEPGIISNVSRLLQTVNLQNNKLTTIKGVFPPEVPLQRLNLSTNQLASFSYDDFPKLLKEVYLDNNNIESITGGIPTQYNLELIDLSSNRLTMFESRHVPQSVVVLNLDNNNISKLQNEVFVYAKKLRKLFLRNNSLEQICTSMFPQNEWPDYDRATMFLAGNPFLCTCEMKWLYNNDVNDNLPFISDMDSVMCAGESPFSQIVTHSTIADNYFKGRFWCKTGRGAPNNSSDICDCRNKVITSSGGDQCSLDCPHNCTCYSNADRSRVVVRCVEAGLTVIPVDAPEDTTVMIFETNFMPLLQPGLFLHYNMTNELFLRYNQLNTIKNFAFDNLRNLTLLNLAFNGLIDLSKDTFVGLSNVTTLNLDNNQLESIDKETFKPLLSLRTLYLSDNQLVRYPAWNLNSLNTLSMVNLGGNPWSCECEFVDQFRKWLLNAFDRFVPIRIDNITCTMATDNSLVPMVTINDTACLKMTNAHLFVTEAVVGSIVGILVSLTLVGLILFYYRKEVQVLIYARYGVRLFCRHRRSGLNLNQSDKPYDVFISFSSLDDQFLVDNILPGLETNLEVPYRLCIHQRDFAAGAFISDAILEAVARSKATLLLLSNNFVESEWCKFEFKAAHLQMLKDPESRVVVVLKHPTLPKNLDPEIKLYLKTNTYLCWGDKLFWKRLYYALPQPSGRNS